MHSIYYAEDYLYNLLDAIMKKKIQWLEILGFTSIEIQRSAFKVIRTILSYQVLYSVRIQITFNIDRWIKTRESERHFQPLDLIFLSSI